MDSIDAVLVYSYKSPALLSCIRCMVQQQVAQLELGWMSGHNYHSNIGDKNVFLGLLMFGLADLRNPQNK